jgi:4-coumarate--CoA ligase
VPATVQVFGKMVFFSKLPKPEPPSSDVFNFIFREGRLNYPASKVVYKVHGTGESLTLHELEGKSRAFADVLNNKYGIKPNDVVAFLANNSVCISKHLQEKSNY